jgi:uncharacterized protein DUF4340
VNSRIVLNLALLAAVATLAVLVFRKEVGNEAPGVSDLDPAKVASVRLERPEQPIVALEKRGGEWRLTAPVAARADAVRVQRLLQFLTTIPARRLPAQDLARFDLDRPMARIQVDGREWAFGMLNPLTQEQYVRGGDWVYPLDARLTADVFAPAMRFFSPRLLADGESPVAFDIGPVKLEQREGRWVVFPAPAEPPSQDDLNRWVNEWRLATAGGVQVATGGSKPLEEIRLRLADGRALSFQVLSREPNLVLVRADEGLAYRFSKAVGDRLLQPAK